MILEWFEIAMGGSVNVAGHELTALDQDKLAEVRGAEIGIVFQSFHLVPTMTAEENVALPLEFQGDAAAFDKARALLADVGLEKRREHFPAEMSGGEQQRVALARALATSPKLILADEPTGNLDGNTGRQVVELLFGMHSKTGTTLVLVTHDEKLAARCQRVLRMADGKILSDETAAAA